MAFTDFPSSPTIGLEYPINGRTYVYNGEAWDEKTPAYTFIGGTLTKAVNEAPLGTVDSAVSPVAIAAADVNSVTISGTTAITAFDSIAAGATRRLVFSGALTLTHNATSLILPGAANITTAAGDVAHFLSLGSGNWRCISYQKASGAAVIAGQAGLTNWAEILYTVTPNNTVPAVVLTPSAGNTNMDVAIRPKGTGAVLAQQADGTATFGNKRGANAVDWQTSRTSSLHVASGANSAISGGAQNTVNASYGGISGGLANTVSASYGHVGGGNSNNVSGQYSVIAGGQSNSNSLSYGSVGGGFNNVINSNYGTIPGGSYASTRGIDGMYAYASGRFASVGDAQSGRYVMRRQTTDATQTELSTLGGAAAYNTAIAFANNSVYAFRGQVVARDVTSGDSAAFKFEGAIKFGTTAASTAFLGTPTVTAFGADAAAAAWAVTLVADTTNARLAVKVTGAAGKTIKWVCVVDTAELCLG